MDSPCLPFRKPEVDDLFVDDKGEIWQCEWLCDKPTCGLVRLTTDKHVAHNVESLRMSGAVGAEMWRGFRLIKQPEKPHD